MKLETKHLTRYLPYGLQVEYRREVTTLDALDIEGGAFVGKNRMVSFIDLKHIKPILRPLSSMLWSEATYINNLVDTGVFLFVDDAGYAQIGVTKHVQSEGDATVSLSNILAASEYLFKKHFDVFGLINKGLAVEKG